MTMLAPTGPRSVNDLQDQLVGAFTPAAQRRRGWSGLMMMMEILVKMVKMMMVL